MLRAVAAALLASALIGCSFVDREQISETRYQEVTINSNVWSSIIPGVTDEQWLLRHVGPPVVIEQQKKERVFVYPLVTHTTDRTHVFLFYDRRNVSSSHFQKRIYLVGTKVNRVETAYPVAASVDTRMVSTDAPAQASERAVEAPNVSQELVDPYAHGQTDPFAHPWPFGPKR